MNSKLATATPTETSRWQSAHGKVAALSRSRPADDPELVDARRRLRAGRAADYLRALVSTGPPLTFQDRAALAGILLGEQVSTDA